MAKVRYLDLGGFGKYAEGTDVGKELGWPDQTLDNGWYIEGGILYGPKKATTPTPAPTDPAPTPTDPAPSDGMQYLDLGGYGRYAEGTDVGAQLGWGDQELANGWSIVDGILYAPGNAPTPANNSNDPGGPTAPTGPTEADIRDAESIIRDVLGRYFTAEQVAELLPMLMAEVRAGANINEARIMTTIRGSNAYRTRFTGMAMRTANGLSAISEAEYISLERYYRQTMMAAGMPAGFYDSIDDFATLIGRDVSPAEFSQRIQLGYVEVQNAPEDVKAQLRMRYGLTDGELLAWFLDEDVALPLIERQVTTARLGAAAARVGINELDTLSLERLARMGITPDQGAQGFARIAADSELYRPLDGGEDQIDLGTGIESTFAGNAAAARRIRQRRERRLAEFQQGGGFAGQGSQRTGLMEA